MNLCYKYKLLPSKSQKSLLNSHFFAFNQAWNGTIKQALTLRDRIYDCNNCGVSMDRDYNACLNILRRAN